MKHKKTVAGIKIKVVLGEMIKKTAGGNHAWFESNVGKIRKPL